LDSKPYAYAIVSVIGHLYTKNGKAAQPRCDDDDESTTSGGILLATVTLLHCLASFLRAGCSSIQQKLRIALLVKSDRKLCRSSRYTLTSIH
jgi:hypothetical protein